jgi:TetR/AcrR family transcriptional repressor of nem operon
MARPRKNEHIKEQLLNVGLETLLTNGYHGTGIKEVLDKLGVPKGSFYHYFRSKEVFAAEVIKFYADDLNHRLSAAVADKGELGLPALKHAFRLLVSEHKEGSGGCILGALASEIAETSDVCRLALQTEVDNWHCMMMVIIQQGQDTGEIRTDLDARMLAKMAWNCWEGSVLRMKIEGRPDPTEEVVEVMFDAMLKAH